MQSNFKSNTNLRAGVMGWPVQHSLSPRLHGYWLRHYGLDGSYVALPVEPANLSKALRDLPAQKFRGVNLTVPHKESALAIVDHVDDVARQAGAINTVIVRPDGSLEGRNTDVFGFSENVQQGGFKPSNRPVAMLGAGGAGRAALVALIKMGIKDIRIINRTLERAQKVADEFGADRIRAYAWEDPRALKEISLLINATTLGMRGQPSLDINLESLPHDTYVTDMVYAPLETDLLRRASAQGNPVIDGLGMLLHQARPAFQAFFGQDPEVTPELRKYVLKED